MHDAGPIAGLVIVVLVVVAIPLVSWWLSPAQQARWRVAGNTLISIADASGVEPVRVTGRIVPIEEVTCPLGGAPCSFWRVQIEQMQGHRKNRRRVMLLSERGGASFMLDDGTGRALIDLLDVTSLLSMERRRENWPGSVSDDVAQLLERYSAEPRVGRFSVSVGRLKAGDTVTVYGMGQWEDDPTAAPQAGGYRGVSFSRRLRIGPLLDGTPLTLTDRS